MGASGARGQLTEDTMRWFIHRFLVQPGHCYHHAFVAVTPTATFQRPPTLEMFMASPGSETLPLRLASTSPRRRQLLAQIGVSFSVVPVVVPEVCASDETPAAYAQRIALAKARAGAASDDAVLVLGADTDVVVDGKVLGKPADPAQALAMLERLSGRTHEVYSAVAMVGPGGREAVRLAISYVTFRPTTDAERHAYLATGEGVDKAGGYAIQGLGAIFIAHLVGSYSGVMGLPLYETALLLREFGVDVLNRVTH
ncbi:septum formation protein [Gammaproteobacteria bacterium]